MDKWKWAQQAWGESFEALANKYQLERVAPEAYWKLHEAELRSHFPPEAFLSLRELRSDRERLGQQRLRESTGGMPLKDFAVLRQNGVLVAMFCGEQVREGTYRMWHTNVHSEHRRKGIYGAIVAGTLAYTRALGFDTVVSEHAPNNNAILIAKLKAGFRLMSFEVDPALGVSVLLKYFHNPDFLAAYEFRCGLATLNERLLGVGAGAFEALREQMGKT